jgi:hypothetical protein
MTKTKKIVNLCRKSKLCRNNLGIPRKKMPQFDKLQTKLFLNYLKKNQIKCVKKKIDVRLLIPTQNQLNALAIESLKKKYKKGTLKINNQTIIVSKNNYIIDGHHRWGTLRSCLEDISQCVNNGHKFNSKISVYQIDLMPLEILRLSKKFNVKYIKLGEK